MEITDLYLKPSFFQEQKQCEFRIPKRKIYSNNIYLEKIGFIITAAGNLQYNTLAGALGVIKSAVLLDNGVEIDSCKNCGALSAFKNKLRPTKRIINKLDTEKSARTAFSFKTEIDNAKAITNQIIGPIDSELIKTTEALTEDAIVPLSFFFPILNQLPSVDTNLFTDLRVRLEFSSDRFDLFNVQNVATYSQIVPVMRLQEIEDPKLSASMAIKSNVSWIAYEHDRYVIPSDAGSIAGQEQTTSVRMNGIRNKSIGRVLIQKAYATTSAATTSGDYGNFASRSLFKEKIQVRVNGSNLFAEGGLGGDKVMDIMAVTTDAFGEYTMIPYEGEYGVGPGSVDDDYRNWEVNTYLDARRLNKGSYIGFHVQGKANDFFIEHKRTCVTGDKNLASMGSAGSASLASLNVNVYFEVKKMLMVKDNKYVVQYM